MKDIVTGLELVARVRKVLGPAAGKETGERPGQREVDTPVGFPMARRPCPSGSATWRSPGLLHDHKLSV